MGLTARKLSDLGQALVEEAERRGAHLRLLGGVAIYLRSPSAAAHPRLRRDYADLDLAVDPQGGRALPAAFAAQGWSENRRFNALHGQTRMLFERDDLQADVFVGVFQQCQRLDLRPRLALASPTLPLADLLLTKLQVIRFNVKDVQDLLALLLDHAVDSDAQSEAIDAGYIARLTADDWGWYTTVHDNLAQLEALLAGYLQGEERERVRVRLADLQAAIEAAPKTVRWRLRDRLGRRVPWYDEPEEVHR